MSEPENQSILTSPTQRYRKDNQLFEEFVGKLNQTHPDQQQSIKLEICHDDDADRQPDFIRTFLCIVFSKKF